MASAIGSIFHIVGRNVSRHNIHKFGTRSKSIKAAVLKNFKEPLVIDSIKKEKLKKNQVSFTFKLVK